MADNSQVEAFLDWLISMDDPDSPEGLAARREVTLTAIIGRAREVREKPLDQCRELEGMTGVRCAAAKGHPGACWGWYGEPYDVAITWPITERPTRLVVEP